MTDPTPSECPFCGHNPSATKSQEQLAAESRCAELSSRIDELTGRAADPTPSELAELRELLRPFAQPRHPALNEARALALLRENAELKRRVEEMEKHTERLFPIMGGPAIPWSMIRPHERQAERNHSQSLERLAQRGGLDPAGGES